MPIRKSEASIHGAKAPKTRALRVPKTRPRGFICMRRIRPGKHGSGRQGWKLSNGRPDRIRVRLQHFHTNETGQPPARTSLGGREDKEVFSEQTKHKEINTMPLTISNNSAVASASYYLGKNQQALQHSIKKLASGKRSYRPNTDPGTLSVAMKLKAATTRLVGAKNNVQNGISFLEVQDGMLETAGRIVGRMAELKGMATQDPMKSSRASSPTTTSSRICRFNSSRYHSRPSTEPACSPRRPRRTGGIDAVFKGTAPAGPYDKHLHQQQRFVRDEDQYTQVHPAFRTDDKHQHQGLGTHTARGNAAVAATAAHTVAFASEDTDDGTGLDQSGCPWVYSNRLCPTRAYLRAQNGGGMSRLTFSADSLSIQETNIRAAIGRIEDVDIAEESANLAKYSILTQAAAAMVAQANTTNDVALMLLR